MKAPFFEEMMESYDHGKRYPYLHTESCLPIWCTTVYVATSLLETSEIHILLCVHNDNVFVIKGHYFLFKNLSTHFLKKDGFI